MYVRYGAAGVGRRRLIKMRLLQKLNVYLIVFSGGSQKDSTKAYISGGRGTNLISTNSCFFQSEPSITIFHIKLSKFSTRVEHILFGAKR